MDKKALTKKLAAVALLGMVVATPLTGCQAIMDAGDDHASGKSSCKGNSSCKGGGS